MSELTYEQRRIIDELVALREGRHPGSLQNHIDSMVSKDRGGIGDRELFQAILRTLHEGRRASGLPQDSQELRAWLTRQIELLIGIGQEAKYAKQEKLLDDFRQRARRQDEVRDRAKTSFIEVSKQIDACESRAELISLVNQRNRLAQLTGDKYNFQSQCWKCRGALSTEIHARCPKCRWMICHCGACSHECYGYLSR